jgi:hypothetical protein
MAVRFWAQPDPLYLVIGGVIPQIMIGLHAFRPGDGDTLLQPSPVFSTDTQMREWNEAVQIT